MAAFQRLRKPDAVFGRNISAKVAFAQTPLHPCEEDLLKVFELFFSSLSILVLNMMYVTFPFFHFFLPLCY